MKKRHATKVEDSLDDYELKPHYDLDYSKAKPNRFAGRVILSHGGVRSGAGRNEIAALVSGRTHRNVFLPIAILRGALENNDDCTLADRAGDVCCSAGRIRCQGTAG